MLRLALVVSTWAAAASNVVELDALAVGLSTSADMATRNARRLEAVLNERTSRGDNLVLRFSQGVEVPLGPMLVQGARNVTFLFEEGAGWRAGVPLEKWPVSGGAYETFFACDSCVGVAFRGPAWGFEGKDVPLDLPSAFIDGEGSSWWRSFVSGQLPRRRPDLVHFVDCQDIRVEGMLLHNSPMFHMFVTNTTGLVVRDTAIVADATQFPTWPHDEGHAFSPPNTDGIDPAYGSRSVLIERVFISNGDDSIAVKAGARGGPCTRDVLVQDSVFERGQGASIGSVDVTGPSAGCVRDVVFRRILMVRPTFGVRIKTWAAASSDQVLPTSLVANVTYQDVIIRDAAVSPIKITQYYDHVPWRCLSTSATLLGPGPPATCASREQAARHGVVPVMNVTLERIVATGSRMGAGLICCDQSGDVSACQVRARDVRIESAWGSFLCAGNCGVAEGVVEPPSLASCFVRR